MEALAGEVFGPRPLSVSPERVNAFLAATGDNPELWTQHAPPGYAAVALFAVTPDLLSRPELAGALAIHGEQRFGWSGPIPVGSEIMVTGRVSKVRERAGVWLVGFELDAGPISGSSIFLIGGSSPPGGAPSASPERAPDEKEEGDFTASRLELLRYAAATGDWNPIHWDHRSAIAAGLPGIVVHGLLQSSWILRELARSSPGPHPFAEARIRFRAPLEVGQAALLDAEESGARLVRDGQELVAATVRRVFGS